MIGGVITYENLFQNENNEIPERMFTVLLGVCIMQFNDELVSLDDFKVNVENILQYFFDKVDELVYDFRNQINSSTDINSVIFVRTQLGKLEIMLNQYVVSELIESLHMFSIKELFPSIKSWDEIKENKFKTYCSEALNECGVIKPYWYDILLEYLSSPKIVVNANS